MSLAPGDLQVNSWGHPNFRAGKRTFVAFEWFQGRPSIAFRLNTAGIDSLVGRSPFFITPYGRGRWVSLWADGRIRWGLVAKLAHRSYQTVALKRMISALYKNASRKA